MKRRMLAGVAVTSFTVIAIIMVIVFSSPDKTVQTETNTLQINENQEQMKTNQQNDGGWGDAETTALTAYALMESGVSPDEVYQNAEGVNVSIANQNVSNAVDYMWGQAYYNEDSTQNITIANNSLWYTSATAVTLNLMTCYEVSEAQNVNVTLSASDQATNASRSCYLQHRLKSLQSQNGSWSNNVTDTALAVYSLKKSGYENETVIYLGVDWLQGNRELAVSPKDTSLTIIALNEYGVNIESYVDSLAEKQRADGSFGTVEETSWAVIALSKSKNDDVLKSRDNAVAQLKKQKTEDNKELALVTLAFIESNEIVEKTGPGPPVPKAVYVLSILVFGALLAVFGLFARIDESRVFDGVRKNIYEYIKLHPGEHLSRIMRTFKMSPGSVTHHLDVLEKTGHIISHKDDRYRRFYVNGNGYKAYTNGEDYKPVISVLKNSTSKKIARFLLSNRKANQKLLAKKLGIHPSTLNWHAKRLRKVGLLSRMRKGKEMYYTISPDAEKVLGLIG
jgi:predicted transcriptional regulator